MIQYSLELIGGNFKISSLFRYYFLLPAHNSSSVFKYKKCFWYPKICQRCLVLKIAQLNSSFLYTKAELSKRGRDKYVSGTLLLWINLSIGYWNDQSLKNNKLTSWIIIRISKTASERLPWSILPALQELYGLANFYS